ncbi:prolyl oligopeptidase family serine peptidase [Variovorax paradoxus]|nr:prolyl oligopeptidase family serine peptidase [Variovorax paradoxus]
MRATMPDKPGAGTDATAAAPPLRKPALLLLPGWEESSCDPHYSVLLAELRDMGWACRCVDLSDPSAPNRPRETATRDDHLQEALAACDALAGDPAVDLGALAVVGISYGGYLAALLSAMRPVQRLAMRAPALYRDEDWHTPKTQLDKEDLSVYRLKRLRAQDNRALAACAAFQGDALVVESGHDTLIAHPVIENYLSALGRASSLTYRVVPGANHGLSRPEWADAFRSLLVGWLVKTPATPAAAPPR